MDLELTGCRALVTGATRGIGAATARRLAAEGADVALVARTPEDLDRAADELRAGFGVDAIGIPTDLRDAGASVEAVTAAATALGGLDLLVNIAGDAPGGRLEELTEDDWDQAFSLKFRSAVRMCRAALPHLRSAGGGGIVNMAGVAGWQPEPHQVALGAVNAAVLNLTRALARDLAGSGIRVNVVVPGPTRTGRWDRLVDGLAESEGLARPAATSAALAGIPDGRPAEPDEVAGAIAFLGAPANSHITGVALEIDGGEVRGLH